MWTYEPSQLMYIVLGVLLVVFALVCVMFPLWPDSLKIGVWYLSMFCMSLLFLLFALIIVRVILFLLTSVMAKPGIWLFPQLLADVGFVESFIPLWAWHEPAVKPEKKPQSEVAKEKQEADDTDADEAVDSHPAPSAAAGAMDDPLEDEDYVDVDRDEMKKDL